MLMKPPVLARLISGGIVSALLVLATGQTLADPVYESGTITTDQSSSISWHTVSFSEAYVSAPVVVMGALSSNGSDPSTVRVRNVTVTGFEWQIDEYDYLDGSHAAETVSYLAMEEGIHSISGLVFEVGRASSGNGYKTVALAGSHAVAPVVFSQAETDANSVSADDTIAVMVRARNVSSSSFQIKLQDQELNKTKLVSESVGYIAVTPGQGSLGNQPFEVIRTGDTLTDQVSNISFGGLLNNPAVLANQQTTGGNDPARIRISSINEDSVDVWLEEEQSKNSEVSHTTEVGGLFVLGEAYGEVDSKLDIFSIDLTDVWQTVTLADTYANPVIVAGPPSTNGGDRSTIRVRNVTPTSFEVQVDEWDYRDGSHTTETISLVVMEAGVFEMGGLTWESGVLEGVTESPTAGSFIDPFSSNPVILGQVVTTNEPEAITHRFASIDGSGFTVELDEEEANDGVHAAETVHYIAIEAGQGTFITAGGLNFSVAATATDVTNANTAVSFGANYAAPVFLADMQTYNETDAATLRTKSLTAAGATLFIEEEQSATSSSVHAGETVGYLVAASALDSDGDGISDEWEIEHGLDPSNPNDAGSDPDLDLLTNLEEFEAGYDPAVFNGGAVSLSNVGGSKNIDAVEKEGTRARYRIRRAVGKAAIAVNFSTDGGNDATTASDASDVIVTNAAGDDLGGTIVIPANATSIDIYVTAVDDGVFEYPENFRVTLASSADYSLSSPTKSGTITDATDDPANDKLYVGLYQAEPWAVGQTSGSGFATMLVNGSNTQARTSSSFGGLSSPQTVAHIHHADAAAPNSVGGPIVIGVPAGQFEGEIWDIVATGAFTGQDLVDTLNKQNGLFLYMNVHSTQFTAGEVRAVFGLAEGGVFDPPADPPAADALTGDDLTRDVARFLTQATFGPTAAEITALVDDITNTHGGDRIAGYSQWIDDQYALDQTNLRDYTYYADQQEWELRGADPLNFANNNDPDHNNRRRGFWTMAIKGHDQLRQRVGFALSEIFIISEAATQIRVRHYGAASYYDMLLNHADGNYRTLIEDVSKSPMMGRYLSHLKNQKSILDPVTGEVLVAPDENYAREIMQLFSVGLLEMNPDGTLKLDNQGLPIQTYTNADITELARVFTGWSFAERAGSKGSGYPTVNNTNFNYGNGPKYFQVQWETPMKNFATYHDTGEKSFLGGTVAAGLDGDADLDAALDIIDTHSNLGPFLARRMIQRLTTSNPSRGYIYRVAQAFESGTYNGSGSGQSGDFAAMAKAILLDYEARSLSLADDISYGKQKEPILRYIQLIRAFDGKSQLPLSDLSSFGYPATQLDNFPDGATRYRYGDTTTQLSQSALRAPSVFNWFLPDYEPGGDIAAAGLVAPEMIQTTETQVIYNINYMHTLARGGNGQGVNALVGQTDGLLDNIKLDRDALQAIYNAEVAGGATVEEAVTALIDHMDVLMMAGNFKATYGAAPLPNPRSTVIDAIVSIGNGQRIRSALYLMASTPEYIHQK